MINDEDLQAMKQYTKEAWIRLGSCLVVMLVVIAIIELVLN
jgi:uncharacterized membrane protein YcjF (UPF0283 family)